MLRLETRTMLNTGAAALGSKISAGVEQGRSGIRRIGQASIRDPAEIKPKTSNQTIGNNGFPSH